MVHKLSIPIAILGLLGGSYTNAQAQSKTHPVVSHQSGYGEEQATFGGPSGVEPELETLDETRDSLYRIDAMTRTFSPWFDWKRELKDDTGIKLAFNTLFLYQHSSEDSPASDRRDSGGGIYRLQGSWGALRTATSRGKLNWRLEARNSIGGSPAPQNHGGEFMASLTPGFPYGDDFDADLSVLSWSHTFDTAGIGYELGRLAFDAYLDPSAEPKCYCDWSRRTRRPRHYPLRLAVT